MPPRIIERIRDRIRLRAIVHAMEEMAEDELDIIDVEQAVLNGRVIPREKDDTRGRNTWSKILRLMARHE